MRRLIPLLTLFALLIPAAANANTVTLGYYSFDNLIPDGATPGVNAFNFNIFTDGSLSPDFPVADDAMLLDATLTLEGDLGTQEFLLGDLGPGTTSPANAEFSDTINFTSATLTATLSESVLNLYDGSTFTPYSTTVTASIVPSSGNDLVAGTDLAAITVSDQAPVNSTPEPSSALMLAGTAFFWIPFVTRRQFAANTPRD